MDIREETQKFLFNDLTTIGRVFIYFDFKQVFNGKVHLRLVIENLQVIMQKTRELMGKMVEVSKKYSYLISK